MEAENGEREADGNRVCKTAFSRSRCSMAGVIAGEDKLVVCYRGAELMAALTDGR